jgi:membrane-bound serine protease (ClpP class)
MRLLKNLSLIIFFYLFIIPCSSHAAVPETSKVHIIPVSGTVEPGMATFIKRAIESAEEAEPIFILELDTFGGRVDAALEIVDILVNIKKGKTIAYVKNKAISAGALIALACDSLIMKNNTTIGDCAPISYSNEGPQMLGEKFQSPLRARFRSLAKRNGYPETLAEAMVTQSIEVFQIETKEGIIYLDSLQYDDLPEKEKQAIISKKTLVKKNELLTMDDIEAVELGFSTASVAGIDELLTTYELSKYELVKINETWSESMVRWLNSISPILMMIGFAALYTELKAPGFGVAGIIGITCLGLVFWGGYLAGLADYQELLLLLTGIILLAVEVFVLPGFGIAGFAGFLFLGAGLILSLQGFVLPNPSFPWEGQLLIKNIVQLLGSSVAAVVLSMLSLYYIIPKLSFVMDGPYLEKTLEQAHADSTETNKAETGMTGTALTFLRPSGKAEINNDFFDVISDGEFIEKDSKIQITEIKGNRIIVARCSDGQ